MFGRQGLPELVRQDEGGLVLAVEIAAQLERAMALRAVHEDGDGGEDIAERHFAAGEDRPAGHAEFMTASLALEARAGGEGVNVGATAPGAERRAVGRGPSDRLEGAERFRVRHAENLRQRQGAGGGGKEEVLAGALV